MDIMNHITAHLAQLNTGDTWTLSAQDLYMSRADFSSLSMLLKHQSEQGTFSVSLPESLKSWLGSTSVTLTKN